MPSGRAPGIWIFPLPVHLAPIRRPGPKSMLIPQVLYCLAGVQVDVSTEYLGWRLKMGLAVAPFCNMQAIYCGQICFKSYKRQ